MTQSQVSSSSLTHNCATSCILVSCREALRAYASTIDEDLRLLGDEAEVAPDTVEQMAVLVRRRGGWPCGKPRVLRIQ